MTTTESDQQDPRVPTTEEAPGAGVASSRSRARGLWTRARAVKFRFWDGDESETAPSDSVSEDTVPIEPVSSGDAAPGLIGRTLATSPPPLSELISYTRAGGWVPGDHPPQAELPGKIYGYCFVVPLTGLLYSLAWLVRYPARLGVAALVVLLFVLFVVVI